MSHALQFRVTPKAMLVALISACYPMTVFAEAGKVEFVVGNVTATGTDGRSRPLNKGADIDAGDTILTGTGRAQVRFTDGGFISLTPNTEFKVNEYNYPGKADGTEKGFYGLVKGGLRAVTGAIGHTNKKTYLVNTPVATIGIRGTEFLATMDEKLIVRVGDGAIYITNDAGDIVLYKGQSGEVGGPGQRPRYTTDEPLVNAAGPAWGTPLVFRQDIRWEQPDQNSYVIGQDTTSDGTACELVGGCISTSTSSMDYLVANSLVGQYSLVSSSRSGASGSFEADFGQGLINNFNMTVTSIPSIGTTGVSNASGTISGGGFSVSANYPSVTYGFLSAGSFEATGAFFGSNASQAGISYTFSDNAGSASGDAVFEQTSLSP